MRYEDRKHMCTECAKEGDETPKTIFYGWGNRRNPNADVLCSNHNNKRKWEERKPNVQAVVTPKSQEDSKRDDLLNGDLWAERPHVCVECEKPIRVTGKPPKYIFSHLMSKGAHREHRWTPENIVFHHLNCHRKWETGERYETNTWKKHGEWLLNNGYKPVE